MIDTQRYIDRRAHLAKLLVEGIAIIPTAPEVVRNGDVHYTYRHDSSFFYLSGFGEPEAVLVVVAGPTPKSILFCRDKDVEREIWDGFRCGPADAKARFGVDDSYSMSELDTILPQLMENQAAVHFPLGRDAAWDARVVGWLNQVRAQSRRGVTAPARLHDVRQLIDEMRLIKDEAEIDIMRRAAQISRGAHARAMQFAAPGRHEYEVEAEILHEFYRHASRAPAYGSIVAAGANACILHYIENDALLKDGDLLLIDAGCELDGYASDITRTFPVNGRFSAVQKDVYDIVLAAQLAAIDAARPGAGWNQPHDAATRVLTQGMLDLKLLSGSLDTALESESYRQFYMHRTGHWIGMDVHDVGDYKRDGAWRVLQADMALTVEPGMYIRPSDTVPAHFWNIGIRIEDDVIITAHGNEVLSAGTPKTTQEIESLMMAQR